MENQTPKPEGQEIIETVRLPNGQFAPGHSGNPLGPQKLKGWQTYGQRAVILGEKYTPAEIREFADNEDLREKCLSYWDGLCVMHMARASLRRLTLTPKGADQMNKERTALLDRIEGTPVQTIRTSALPPVDPDEAAALTPAARQRAYDELMKT